ncbi:MAG: hypothetical protein AAF570_16085 [Bacteroidota bacterium]
MLPVHITGTVDKPKYRLDGHYVADRIDLAVKKQGDELKAGWKTETEELFGAPQDTAKVDDLVEVVENPADNTNGVDRIIDKIKNPFKKLNFRKKKVGGKEH